MKEQVDNKIKHIIAYVHHDREKIKTVLSLAHADSQEKMFRRATFLDCLEYCYLDKDGRTIKCHKGIPGDLVEHVTQIDCWMEHDNCKRLRKQYGIYWKAVKNDLSGVAERNGQNQTEGEPCRAEKEWSNA